MLLRQMQFFVSIIEETSFTKAAEINHISQSAISQAMNALEADLGVKLLERKKRSFQITPAGEYFYRRCKTLLTDIENMRQETVRLGSDKGISLRVGYINLYAGAELSEAIAEFTSLYPEVSLSVRSGTHEELYAGLVSGELDLTLSDQRRAFSSEYVNMELKNAECMIEISEQNPLAAAERVELTDLAQFSCIIISSRQQRETETEYYRNILGFSGDFLYAETRDEARLMVVGNRGILPVEAVGRLPELSDSVRRIPLYRKRQRIRRKYCLFWQKARTGYYIEGFAELLRKRLL